MQHFFQISCALATEVALVGFLPSSSAISTGLMHPLAVPACWPSGQAGFASAGAALVSGGRGCTGAGAPASAGAFFCADPPRPGDSGSGPQIARRAKSNGTARPIDDAAGAVSRPSAQLPHAQGFAHSSMGAGARATTTCSEAAGSDGRAVRNTPTFPESPNSSRIFRRFRPPCNMFRTIYAAGQPRLPDGRSRSAGT
jgi:hypothetical protein